MHVTDGPVLECKVQFKRGRHTRKHIVQRADMETPIRAGRIPRVSRLMALAIKLDQQIRDGEFEDWAEVARLGHLTRGRASQIANLTLLAPDIIEDVLNLPEIERGRDPITERDVRPIAGVVSWAKQRRLWAGLCNRCHAMSEHSRS